MKHNYRIRKQVKRKPEMSHTPKKTKPLNKVTVEFNKRKQSHEEKWLDSLNSLGLPADGDGTELWYGNRFGGEEE